MAFAVGDVVWLLDPSESTYMKGTVDRVIDFMLNISYVDLDGARVWVDYENEHLIPVVKSD
jgi:hypothetical protein